VGNLRSLVVPVTSAADGTATAYSEAVSGYIEAIVYTKTDYTDGVDFTITAETSAIGIWTESNVNASTVRHPRAATHHQDGTAALHAAAGTAVNDKIPLVNERVKIVLASGGATKAGSFRVIVS